MADQEHGQLVDAGQLGEDVRQLGHGAEQIEVPPPLIHVGNECFQYQAGLCKVEPPGHEPDVDIPFNVPQNVPSQCASVPPPLMYVGNFKETIEKLVQEQVGKSLDPIVQRLEQATRALRPSRESWGWSQHVLSSRGNKTTVNGRKICNICGKPGHIAQNCPNTQITCYRCGVSGHIARHCTPSNRVQNGGRIAYSCPEERGCFNCGDLGHFARQCPKRKQNRRSDGGPQVKQEPNNSSRESTCRPAGQSNWSQW
jgi:hypothetical protein